MSFGLHNSWRDAVVRKVFEKERGSSMKILDMATGTADLAIAMARRVQYNNANAVSPLQVSILGVDPSEGMLACRTVKEAIKLLAITFIAGKPIGEKVSRNLRGQSFFITPELREWLGAAHA